MSIPDRVFVEAEQVAKRLRISRSRLYSDAIAAFVEEPRGRTVRESLEVVYCRESSRADPVLTKLQARALRETW